MTVGDYPYYIYPTYPSQPYMGGGTCTCTRQCPLHPKPYYVYPTTTTIYTTSYVPRHRKPGPAQ